MEFQIKTTIRYHYTLIRMVKIQKTDSIKSWQRYEATRMFIHCWWKWKWWKTVEDSFLQSLTIWPTVALLVIYPNEWKTYVYTITCTYMFIAALFIITPHWKQPRCPSIGEWISKLWYIHTMEYYSVIKINELSSHEKTWRKLECKLLSERSQSENATDCMIPTIWHFRNGKAIETVKKCGCQSFRQGEREDEWIAKG